MTSIFSSSAPWPLQDAKARFSELVRRVEAEGPQVVSVHGRRKIIILSVEDFARLRGQGSGAQLIEAMQASPEPELELLPESAKMPVRDVSL